MWFNDLSLGWVEILSLFVQAAILTENLPLDEFSNKFILNIIHGNAKTDNLIHNVFR